MPSNDTTVEERKSADIILSVLNGSPFKIRPDDEKLAILEKRRPLPNLTIVKRGTSSNSNGSFQASWYSIYKWLCGSTTYNKLFCWPCLLMRPETSSWCSTGNDDIKRFTSLAAKHAACKSHLKAISEYDEILTKFNLYPEFVNESKLKFKEEEGSLSDKTEADDLINFYFNEEKKKEDRTKNSSNSNVQAVTDAECSMNETDSSDVSGTQKTNTKITFKTWQEISRNSFPVPKSKFLDDIKLYKWKRKIAQQELKNARLTEEKLKFEIEVLKAKVEYYKSLKQDLSKEDENSTPINGS